ncbi:MAG: 2-C-methyl-D-erythritol 4-phosphate cytidylyltransferase [Treponema sp.]|jgi:2-C-methyl-D-erythritol 4-phosphate cytidylyltransferase/2-C-methyl-D-erythritol 4-phosphate cytidylyltransferase/2-C-methyl-D-erythritol 2,4-cyclodiphosphate synthase|nr:2-C-methyl-D-erythritol 4-phosphate cytidylyltransferase [Treponema sp.]
MNRVAVAAIIAAAGASRRMGGVKKEYQALPGGKTDEAGKPLTVLGAAALAFAAVSRIGALALVFPPDREGPAGQPCPNPGAEEAALRSSLPKALFQRERPRLCFVSGGASRRASIHRALTALAPCCPAYVLIHDGARPWIGADLIERVLQAVLIHQAVIPVLPLVETPKELNPDGRVIRHLRRAQVGIAQTPQAFAYPAILQAHEQAAIQAAETGIEYTDDAEVWGAFQGPVIGIPGALQNRKITFPEDLAPEGRP